MSQKKVNLKELDFNNIGNWPQQAKIVFCALLALLIVGLSWFVLITARSGALELSGTVKTYRYLDDVELEAQEKAAAAAAPGATPTGGTP